MVQAIRLARMGYYVFPLSPGTKTPKRGGRGHLDATTDEQTIRSLFQPHDNIGISLAVSGVVVVDVDMPDINDERFVSLIDKSDTPLVITPSLGYHLYFRADDIQGRHIGVSPHIDILADGYVVAPGSMIGQNEYSERRHLVSISQLPSPPQFINELLLSRQTTSRSSAETAVMRQQIENTDVVDYTSGVIPNGERHSTLVSIAGRLRSQGANYELLSNMLKLINRQRCNPPLPENEVERIARDYAIRSISEIFARKQLSRQSTEIITSKDQPEPQTSIEPYIEPAKPFPLAVSDFRGVFGSLLRASMRSAVKPSIVASSAGVLSLLSAIYGRYVRDIFDTSTSLFCVLLAPSGAGKEHPRRFNRAVVNRLGLHQIIQDRFASGEGIEDYIATVSAIVLFQYDEVHTFTRSMRDPRNTNAQTTAATLMSLYSASQSTYATRVKATKKNDRGSVIIHRPCVSVFGTSVTQFFLESMSREALSNGFFARLLIFNTGHAEWSLSGISIDKALAEEDLSSLYAWTHGVMLSSPASIPLPYEAVWSDEAMELRRLDQQDTEARVRQSSDNMLEEVASIWARVVEQTSRVAIILACAHTDNPAQVLVTREDYEQAHEIVQWCVQTQLDLMSKYVHHTNEERNIVRFAQIAMRWYEEQRTCTMPYSFMAKYKLVLTSQQLADLSLSLRGISALSNVYPGPRGGTVFEFNPVICQRLARGVDKIQCE